MRRINHFAIILVVLFLGSGVLSVVSAQVAPSDPIQSTVTPENPSPLQDVTISVVSYLNDLRSGRVVWYKDGKKIADGDGLVSITTKAPANGKTSTINIIVTFSNGSQMKKTIVIRVGQVDILWQSNGSVPQMYRGKALYGHQNSITFSAIPALVDTNGKVIDPKNLVYTWKKGYKVLGEQSGAGRQTLTLKGDFLDDTFKVTVVVTSRDGKISAESSLGVESSDAKILFYENDPLYGVLYNKALTSKFPLKNSEVTAQAVPMFFSTDEINFGALKFIWMVNGIERTDLATKNSIVLKTNGESDGNANVSIQINNSESILQTANNGFQAYFSKKPLNQDNPTF